MLDTVLNKIRSIIPEKAFGFLQPAYHLSLSFISALVYRFPSRHIKIIVVTGTKGKSSTVEIINSILEQAGYKTALTNTIRFKIGDKSEENLFKMSMPGRFFMQRFIRRAVDAGCNYAVLEMTSQGAVLFRHLFIEPNCFVLTNISPEHIEAHGSYENYVQAKLSIARMLEKSNKSNKTLIVNSDDKEAERFLSINADRKITYSIKDAEPYKIEKEGLEFTFDGKNIHSHLSGQFNLYNILAAITVAKSENTGTGVIVSAIENISGIKGRVEKVQAGQDFDVVVDYAHTPDSLEKLYKVFQSTRNICVLGGTGGGRDNWKRAEMGKLAQKYCDEIILTNEDPYDEDPMKIIEDVAKGITYKQPKIIIDRREAIREAVKLARKGDAVLITGKGTDPYIMGAKGSKIPWSDSKIAKEEIERQQI